MLFISIQIPHSSSSSTSLFENTHFWLSSFIFYRILHTSFCLRFSRSVIPSTPTLRGTVKPNPLAATKASPNATTGSQQYRMGQNSSNPITNARQSITLQRYSTLKQKDKNRGTLEKGAKKKLSMKSKISYVSIHNRSKPLQLAV